MADVPLAALKVLWKCINWVYAPIKKECSYVLQYKDNIEKLKNKHGELKDLVFEIKERVKAGERELRKPAPAVDAWLKDMKAYLEDDEWNDYMDWKKIRKKDESCSGLLHWNLKHRYSVSKRAIEKFRIIEEKIKKMEGRGPTEVCLPEEPLMLGSMPTAYSKSLASRESTIKEIMEALKNKEVHVIGIYGMGGVGKTTLIEEAARRVEADGLFSKVVIAEVSQAPNVLMIQQQIAERIALPLKDSKIVDERARKIHERLSRNTSDEASDVVILDNIWKKLDLEKVGIPHNCKIVLTTRNKDVCRDMDADKLFEVQGLDDTEAIALFLERARLPADHDDAFKSMTSELVKKCEGLPLSIVVLADAMRDQDLSVWKHIAAQLGRPGLARVGGVMEENVCPILQCSYNFLSGDEKKKFFLLCCLFPLGSSIAVQDLMRYGAGLGLFQHMDSLDEATKQANSWVSELKSLSLLLEAEDEQHVKLQDVVRKTLMSIATKGRNLFQFGSFSKLLMKETFRTYTAISMTIGHSHEPLSQFKFPKLEMLLLKGSWPSDDFSNNFFQGMKSLKVLVISDMKFQTLPSSITQLKNLKTLHLERCELSDISTIVELVDLLFLSLRESTIAKLPEKFENLVHLKLLDLTGCSKLRKIHVGVITRLTELEELYLMGSFRNEGWDNEENGVSLIALKFLSCLAVLELHVPCIDLLPGDLSLSHKLKSLLRFQISIGNQALNTFFSPYGIVWQPQWKLSSQILLLENMERRMLHNQSINCLIQKTECLLLVEIKGLINVTNNLVNNGFRNLKRLYVENCSDMEYIGSTNKSNKEGVFPKLEELIVKGPCKLKGIYHGSNLYDSFDHLKRLYLEDINFLRSFWDNDDDVQDDKPFFNKKMKFPNLEVLEIKKASNIVELWHSVDVEEEVPTFPRLVNLTLWDMPKLRSIWRSNDVIILRSFQNLKRLDVRGCSSLETLCPLSVAAALEQLDYLHVSSNNNMKEIIAKETGEMKYNDTEMAIFPKLQEMRLWSLPNLKCLFEGSIKLVFPSLERITCFGLKKMMAFVIPEYPENSNALFNDQVVMPAIKDINIIEAHELQEIWGSHIDAMSFNELETINIRSVDKVTKIFSLDAVKQMQNLKTLILQDFELAEEFIELVGFYNNEVENLASLPQLKKLVIDSFEQLKQIPWEELALENLQELQISKIDGLTSFFSTSVCKRFVNLETLSICYCEKMEEIVRVESWDTNIIEDKIEFPHLNFLRLSNLPALRTFSSTNCYVLKFPSLEEVEINVCPMMETFSYGSLDTPRLYKININQENENECFDLNTAIKKRIKEKTN